MSKDNIDITKLAINKYIIPLRTAGPFGQDWTFDIDKWVQGKFPVTEFSREHIQKLREAITDNLEENGFGSSFNKDKQNIINISKDAIPALDSYLSEFTKIEHVMDPNSLYNKVLPNITGTDSLIGKLEGLKPVLTAKQALANAKTRSKIEGTLKFDLLPIFKRKFPAANLTEKDMTRLYAASDKFLKDLKDDLKIKNFSFRDGVFSIPLSGAKHFRSYLSEFTKIEHVKDPGSLWGRAPLNIRQTESAPGAAAPVNPAYIPIPAGLYAAARKNSGERGDTSPNARSKPEDFINPIPKPAGMSTSEPAALAAAGQYGSIDAAMKQATRMAEAEKRSPIVPAPAGAEASQEQYGSLPDIRLFDIGAFFKDKKLPLKEKELNKILDEMQRYLKTENISSILATNRSYTLILTPEEEKKATQFLENFNTYYHIQYPEKVAKQILRDKERMAEKADKTQNIVVSLGDLNSQGVYSNMRNKIESLGNNLEVDSLFDRSMNIIAQKLGIIYNSTNNPNFVCSNEGQKTLLNQILDDLQIKLSSREIKISLQKEKSVESFLENVTKNTAISIMEKNAKPQLYTEIAAPAITQQSSGKKPFSDNLQKTPQDKFLTDVLYPKLANELKDLGVTYDPNENKFKIPKKHNSRITGLSFIAGETESLVKDRILELSKYLGPNEKGPEKLQNAGSINGDSKTVNEGQTKLATEILKESANPMLQAKIAAKSMGKEVSHQIASAKKTFGEWTAKFSKKGTGQDQGKAPHQTREH